MQAKEEGETRHTLPDGCAIQAKYKSRFRKFSRFSCQCGEFPNRPKEFLPLLGISPVGWEDCRFCWKHRIFFGKINDA
jgi:hypothetical protein